MEYNAFLDTVPATINASASCCVNVAPSCAFHNNNSSCKAFMKSRKHTRII